MHSKAKNNRRPYFDMLRGVAVIMVVGIHTFPNGTNGLESMRNFFTVILRMILNCAVPLFLGISGYFIGQKDVSTKEKYHAFLRHQIPAVYTPCLCFSAVWLIIEFLNNGRVSLGLVLRCFFCGMSVYYFIALIIQYYLLLPVLQKITGFRWGGIFVTIMSFSSIIIVTYITKIMGHDLPLLMYAGPFPLWILFFYMGLYSKNNRDYQLYWPIFLIVAGLILQIFEYVFFLSRGIIVVGIKFSSFIFSTGIICTLLSSKIESFYASSGGIHILNYIGRISFGIYLIHMFLIKFWHIASGCDIWIINWMVVLFLSIAVIYIAKRIAPDLSARYLGFRG